MNHTININIVHAKTGTANGIVPVYLSDQTGRKLCAVWGNEEQRYANATLWANSPDMYELLKDISTFYQNTSDENPIAKRIRQILGAIDGAN